MKKARIIVVLLICIIAVVVFRRGGVEKVREAQAVPLRTNNGPTPSLTLSSNVSRSPAVQQNVGGVTNDLQPDIRERLMHEADLVKSEDVPIVFYGKVVDQDGAGVVGVHVRADVTAYDAKALESSASTSFNSDFPDETISDAKGNFQFTQKTGKILNIRALQKAGYEEKKSERTFAFSPAVVDQQLLHKPDITAPVVFHLWRKQKSEPLIKGSQFVTLEIGNVYTIDLAGKQKYEGKRTDGDFTVKILRPRELPKGKYDWTMIIEATEGGIIETKDEFLYQAPLNGYENSYVFTMKMNDANWDDEHIKKAFYLKSQNGKRYIGLTLEAYAHFSDKAAVDLTYLINPNSSRNLQYDRDNEIGLNRAR